MIGYVVPVAGWHYLLWGIFGGFAVEGLEFATAVRRIGNWPWRDPAEVRPLPFIVSTVIRVGVGGGLAAAYGIQGQITGPVAAVTLGVAAPLLLDQMGKLSSTARLRRAQTGGEDGPGDDGSDDEDVEP